MDVHGHESYLSVGFMCYVYLLVHSIVKHLLSDHMSKLMGSRSSWMCPQGVVGSVLFIVLVF